MSLPHSQPSSPAKEPVKNTDFILKAGDPVFRGADHEIDRSRCTGYSAEPAIRLAEDETRWRSMTGLAGASFFPLQEPAGEGEGATVAKVATGRSPFPA
jgi:hypothetical protein